MDWEDTNKEFTNVSPDKYITLLGDHTFKTEKIEISIDEGEAMVRSHKNEGIPGDEKHLTTIQNSLDDVIKQFNGRAFVKLEDLSPKDQLTVDFSNIPEKPKDNLETNYYLKKLLYLKGRSMLVTNGEEALKLLIKSERCMIDELVDRKHYNSSEESKPSPAVILIREWSDINPEMELRGFVINGKLLGLSQMATMGVSRVHSDFLLSNKGSVGDSALSFFNNTLRPLLQNNLPVTTYVIDLVLVSESCWKVVELNPFSTSMEGHLFIPFPTEWVTGNVQNCCFEYRLHPFTSATVLSDPELPSEWNSFLKNSSDEYGHHYASPLSRNPTSELFSSHTFEASFIIIAGRYPINSVQFDPGEVHDFLIPSLNTARYVKNKFSNCNIKITVIARVEDVLSSAVQPIQRLDLKSWRNLVGKPPMLFSVTGHTIKKGFSATELTPGDHIKVRPMNKNAIYTATVNHVNDLNIILELPGLGIVTYSIDQMMSEIFWLPDTTEAQDLMQLETAAAKQKLDDYSDEEIEMLRNQYYNDLEIRKKEIHENELSALRKASTDIDIQFDGIDVNAKTFRKVVQEAVVSSKKLIVYIASHGSLSDDHCSSSYVNFPYEPCRISGIELKKIFTRALEKRDCVTTSVLLLCGTCYSSSVVDWVSDVNDSYATIVAISSAKPDRPNTAIFMDAVPHAIEECYQNESLSSMFDLFYSIKSFASSGFDDESPQPEAASQFRIHTQNNTSAEKISLNSMLPEIPTSILRFDEPLNPTKDVTISGIFPPKIADVLLRLLKTPPEYPTYETIKEISLTPGEILNKLMEVELEKETAAWVDVMERLEKGGLVSSNEKPQVMRGNADHVDKLFWIKNKENDVNNVISYSFEIEGHQLRILDYYKIKNYSDDQWMALDVSERFSRAGSRWVSPLFRMDKTSKIFPFFNHQLHPEANGSCWEIIYSGDTVGYTTDFESLFSDLEKSTDTGLSLIELQHDSGVQIHISFPIPVNDLNRNSVIDILVLASDFLFLKGFEHTSTDDLNVLYTDDDIQKLRDCQSPDQFEKLLSATDSCPNAVYKHKIIGCRGRDVYNISHRMGFEIRRGFSDLHDLHHVCDSLRKLLTIDPSVYQFRLNKILGNLPLTSLHEFNTYFNKRVVPSSDFELCWEGVISIDVVHEFLSPFYLSMTKWNYQNTSFKSCVSHSWMVSTNDLKKPPSIASSDHQKIVLQTFAFVLLTDWSVFPHSAAESSRNEQQAIIKQLNSLSDIQNSQARNVKLEYLRLHTVEFARRLSQMF